MVQAEDLGRIRSKRKAIVAIFPYATWRERGGDRRMVDAFSGIFRVPDVAPFMARPITMLLGDVCPNYPNLVVTLVSPHISWGTPGFNGNTVAWWATAALEIPYTEEVGQSVVDTLLQIASVDGLQPYIPVDIWAWLKKCPYLPPICNGRSLGTRDRVVRRVREIEDVEILESYFLLVWSEWNVLDRDGFAEMRTSIREDFAGIGMGHHREVLLERLDHVLGQLRWAISERLNQQNPSLAENHIPVARGQYGKLKQVLVEVDREALEILTRTSFALINSFNSLTRPQNPTRRSVVPSLSRVRSCAFTRLASRSPNSVLHLHSVHPATPPSFIDRIDHHPTLQTIHVSHHLRTWFLDRPSRMAHRDIIISVFIQSRVTQLPFMPCSHICKSHRLVLRCIPHGPRQTVVLRLASVAMFRSHWEFVVCSRTQSSLRS